MPRFELLTAVVGASELLRFPLALAPEADREQVVGEVSGPAESFGVRSAGLRRRYYHDNNEDALIMWRTEAKS